MDLTTGIEYAIAEGTRIENISVFAGKSTRIAFRKAEKYAERYGGKTEDWQHVKGIALISTEDGDRKANIHWVQCKGIGKREMFKKEWYE